MTKGGKVKTTRNEDTPVPQTRSLRSKMRASCSAEESSQTHDVQAAPLQKDSEGEIKEADNLLQDSATVTNIQHQEEEQSNISKPDDSNLENNSEGTQATDTANKVEEKPTVRDPDQRFEEETCGEQAEACNNGKETGSEECSRSPSQPQMSLPASEDYTESCCSVLEKQMAGKKWSNLKRNQAASDDESSLSDVKESVVGLPAKKKRRMGMCGLTEKERSHFLQAQQRNSVQNGAGSTERPALQENASPSDSQSTPPHISAEVVEERKEELEHPPPHRAEVEVHIVVTGSDGTPTTSDPDCSEGRKSEARNVSLPDPELNGYTEPTEPAKEEEGKHLENLQPPEVKEPTPGIVTLVAKVPIKAEQDLSSRVETNPLNENEATEQEESGAEAARPEMFCVNGTTNEMPDAICGDGAERGASSAGTEGVSCGSEKLCEALLTPSVQEMNHSCDPSYDPAAAPSAVHTERTPTWERGGSSGSGFLDYVSDSQLNTIVLTEEKEEEPDPSGQTEDATELICGLIRELSSLKHGIGVCKKIEIPTWSTFQQHNLNMQPELL